MTKSFNHHKYTQSVSIYSHILTEEECDELPYMHYDAAKRKMLFFDYLQGELKFIRWLDLIYQMSGGCASINGRLISSTRFNRIVLLGLRERVLTTIEFPSLKFSIKFGFDQTHDILSSNVEVIKNITDLAVAYGLFVINSIRKLPNY